MSNEKNQIPENLENRRPQDFHFHPAYYPYFNGKYAPWYDDEKDYNTNAPSYYDYLAHRNYSQKLMVDLLNRVARRNINVIDTKSIDMTKQYDWISEDDCNNYHDIINIWADVKLSKASGNTLVIKDDGLFTTGGGSDSGLAEKLEKEIRDRTQADEDLKAKLQKEVQDRTNGDNGLGAKLEKEIRDRNQGDNDLLAKYNDLLSKYNDLNSKYGGLTNALTKIVTNLRDAGAWQGDINGSFKPNRYIANGNINVFSNQPDGSYFIRTSDNPKENDIVLGVS